MKSIAIIGAGPAGLRAAEVAATNGAKVTIYDAMRSVGRKFLLAGKRGLNITHSGNLTSLSSQYSGHTLPSDEWFNILQSFDNHALEQWVIGLGLDTFTASSGKIFPGPDQRGMKAAPLLRRWVARLRTLGVTFKLQHRWYGFLDKTTPLFRYKGNSVSLKHDAVILALGGASWPQTGSDGHWVNILSQYDISSSPLQASNCGWETDWPPAILDEAEGLPMKNLLIHAGNSSCKGELVITRYGLEGAPIYRLGPQIRSQLSPHIIIDFKPHTTTESLIAKLGKTSHNYVREARRRWKLDPATCALLKHLPDRGPWQSASQLAHEVKHCPIPLTRPRPIEEAISSAGGVAWSELTPQLMLKKLPGVYLAGEMIDWDAPTGGYLLQACFSTGTHAGISASQSIS